ncbi:MAG TPA: DUF2249 domain-containing protein [Thermomicrobiales bacterium]|nr:DUF2249 domain-containing protein [Thermomicrobiales bacterium]
MTTTEQEPILASWKISEVLQKHPELLDYLVDLTPAFQKLRNPIMRKVQTRLVTVEQAAGIAGIDPRVLTRKLNQQAGITPPVDDSVSADTGTESGSARPAWFGKAEVFRELDVRPMLERGEEPFNVITTAARGVPVGQVLRLIVGFEPLPLYDALKKQGFASFGEREDGAWHVEFLREREAGSPSPKPARAAAAVDWDAPTATEVTIDVSELVPPEPMVKILQALETLPEGGRLLVHHVRRPIHLYDRLDEMGYPHDTREIAPDHVEVLIVKPSGTPS